MEFDNIIGRRNFAENMPDLLVSTVPADALGTDICTAVQAQW